MQFLISQPGSHPTADPIFRAINSSDPRFSRATVYDNLHARTEAAGLFLPVSSLAMPPRFATSRRERPEIDKLVRVAGAEFTTFYYYSILRVNAIGFEGFEPGRPPLPAASGGRRALGGGGVRCLGRPGARLESRGRPRTFEDLSVS